MMNAKPEDTGRGPSGGFSLVELLVVIGIIGLAAAISLPAIGRFILNYKIRGAAQQVAGEIQTARNKAIGKNVNLGVVFVVTSPTTYRYAVEDDQTGTGANRTSARELVSARLADAAQAGPERSLPMGIQFASPIAANCPAGVAVPVGVANDAGMRFNRLGGWCDPTGTTAACPALTTGSAPLVYNSAAGSTICLTQISSSVRRAILVVPGGRVRSLP